MKVKSLSPVPFFATPWTVADQAPPSMGFSRQEYWKGLPFSPPGDLLNPGIKPVSPVFPALAGKFLTTEPPGKALHWVLHFPGNFTECSGFEFIKCEPGGSWDVEVKQPLCSLMLAVG